MNYITIPKLAKMLNLSRTTIFNWVKSGKIKASKVGGTWIIDDPDIMQTLRGELTEKQKEEIDQAVLRAIEEYGQVFKQLSQE